MRLVVIANRFAGDTGDTYYTIENQIRDSRELWKRNFEKVGRLVGRYLAEELSSETVIPFFEVKAYNEHAKFERMIAKYATLRSGLERYSSLWEDLQAEFSGRRIDELSAEEKSRFDALTIPSEGLLNQVHTLSGSVFELSKTVSHECSDIFQKYFDREGLIKMKFGLNDDS